MAAQRFRSWLHSRLRAIRSQGSWPAEFVGHLRLAARAEGRALLWTRLRHGAALHQTSATSWADRYPELFDFAARAAPPPTRILSFGCSTGEEMEALRRRFPKAAIVGAEINPRSRKAARERMADDPNTVVVGPDAIEGSFDQIFALAVLQRLPDRVAALGIEDLSRSYPFERFDQAVAMLTGRLEEAGLLCVMNAHYRVEDSRSAEVLQPVDNAPTMSHPLFGRDSRRLSQDVVACSVFRKIRGRPLA